MKRGDRTAGSPATAMAGIIMLLVLPLSFFVGLFLIIRLNSWFEPYCRYLEDPEPDGWRTRQELAA